MKLCKINDKHIKINKIASGNTHTIFICENNKIYSYGHNLYGQLGIGHTNEVNDNIVEIKDIEYDIDDIKCGSFHNILLCKNNLLYSWGYNNCSQCNTINEETYITSPYLFDKLKELGIDYSICKIYATEYETILIIDQFQM